MSRGKQTNQPTNQTNQPNKSQTPNKPPEKLQIHDTTGFQRHAVI